MEYIIKKYIDKKNLLIISFNKEILNHLCTKCDNKINLLQSLNDLNRFLLIKSDTGYRIKRHPCIKKIYQVYISYPYEQLKEFSERDVLYFKKKNRSILIKINQRELISGKTNIIY